MCALTAKVVVRTTRSRSQTVVVVVVVLALVFLEKLVAEADPCRSFNYHMLSRRLLLLV